MSWQKGQSGNPGGRLKVPREVTEMFRSLTDDSVAVLHNLMMSPSTADAVRAGIANSFLDRGWGRATQSVDVSVAKSVVDVTDEELMAIIKAAEASEAAEQTDIRH